MAQATSIEWTQQVWNFLRGCRRISAGCGGPHNEGGCYAERQAIRHAGPGGAYEGLVKSTPNGPRWTGEISFHEDILLAPLRRKTPTTYFVNSMSDLFYEKVTDKMLDKAFAVMALTPQHTYQILTKRPERMLEYCPIFIDRGSPGDALHCWASEMADWLCVVGIREHQFEPENGELNNDHVYEELLQSFDPKGFLPNVWLGVSVEDQKTADERIPLLLDTPAAVRWISAEPLLGPVNLAGCEAGGAFRIPGTLKGGVCDRGLDWVVVGGESGPRSRPFDIAWARSIIEQCNAAGVPVFVKQLGAKPKLHEIQSAASVLFPNGVPEGTVCEGSIERFETFSFKNRKGGDMSEWPEDLQIREFPEVANA